MLTGFLLGYEIFTYWVTKISRLIFLFGNWPGFWEHGEYNIFIFQIYTKYKVMVHIRGT